MFCHVGYFNSPNPSVDELIDNLSQLDSPTLDYIVSSLNKVQKERTQKTMMPEAKFWQLIDGIDWKQKQDIYKLKPLIKVLKTHSNTDIFQFAERLAFLLYQLDGPTFLQALKKSELGYSADSFLYTRCFVVAKGKKFYQSVQNTPSKIPIESYLESLLYVPKQAFELKIGNYILMFRVLITNHFSTVIYGERMQSLFRRWLKNNIVTF